MRPRVPETKRLSRTRPSFLIDQAGDTVDEALGCRDHLGCQFGGHLGTWAGFIIGNGLEIVCTAEERAQFRTKAWLVLGQPSQFALYTPMRLGNLACPLNYQCFRPVQAREISRAARFVGPVG